uniref:Uncharacterized protein n=1 Tax=Anguilla anguilla TaxID=7936 RepID=A0A0E9P6D8_ANGAN
MQWKHSGDRYTHYHRIFLFDPLQ